METHGQSFARRSIISLLVTATLLWHWSLPTLAHADLAQELSNLFQQWGAATINQPGAYASQQRGFLSAGSVHARVYQRRVPPLISFSTPRFDVGCNGVDLYLGSFSYVKLDQFVRLLQQLGMSAVAGYAFKLAMKVMCETCANVLDSLENAIRQLNSLTNVGPCKASIGNLVDRGVKTWEAAKDLWGKVQTASGAASDLSEALANASSKSADAIKQDLFNTQGFNSWGNMIWTGLQELGLTARDSREFMELIMSVVGTVVFNFNTQTNSYDTVFYPPLLKVTELIEMQSNNASQRPALVYRCDDPTDCLDPAVVEVAGFRGLYEWTVNSLTSIKDKLRNPFSVNARLTDNEQRFIELSPMPAFEQLRRRSVDATKMDQYISANAQFIAVRLAYEWIDVIIRFAEQSLTQRQKKVSLEPGHAEVLKQFQEQLRAVRQEILNELQIQYRHLEIVKTLMPDGDSLNSKEAMGHIQGLAQPATRTR